MKQWEERHEHWLAQVQEPELCAELARMAPAEREDAFGRELEFGTGGLRGILGAGTNRMNMYTVRRATQGLADYLKEKELPLSVAIAHDSRLHGREFAEQAASVLAANGIAVWLYPRLEPTPALSWAVRWFGCGAGICITASHNPAQYNGYKVYGPDGCQITLEAAAAIERAIGGIDCFAGVRACDYGAACADGRIRAIPDRVLEAFVDAVCAQRVSDAPCGDLRLVYTPLCGSGMECVEKMLHKLGVTDVTVVPSQREPDGHFPTCPYPNPEIREAMEEGLRICESVQPDILIGTDPDCDRCGAAVRGRDGGYHLISGNEMGVLLLNFICMQRQKAGTMPHAPVAVTTVVSTGMADVVAEQFGVELRRTLTGFKYIGEQIGRLEREGHPERFIFGFEESYGYLSGSHVRDKDGVNAVMLICQMVSAYKREGRTLLDVLDELSAVCGCYANGQAVFTFPGEAGMEAMHAILRRLRAQPPAVLGGMQVERILDYAHGLDGLPATDMLELRLSGGKVMVRPSGTEPKLKAYLEVRGADRASADAALSRLNEACRRLILEKAERTI